MLVKDAAREAADKVLRDYWTADRLPVDPVAIARQMGIEVDFTEMADLSGVIVHDEGSTHIVIADNELLERQLFTCAHELGHYMERKQSGDPDYSFSEPKASAREQDQRGGEWSLHEYYADEFAGNLLMPQQEFIRWYSASPSVSSLADVFGVSRAAVQTRLRRLRKDGLLPPVA